MSRLLFAWDRSRSQLRQQDDWRDRLIVLGLGVAAAILCFFNITGASLSPLEQEAFKTFSALKLANLPFISQYLKIADGVAFLQEMTEKMPWLLRLPNATLTALSIPLLYSLARENFRLRHPSLLSALIYLTFLPILSHGRLVGVQGLILYLEILLFWCGLRSRRDLRWTLGVGFSLAFLMLLHPWIWISMGVILLLFWVWDTPRLITSRHLWLGWILGSLPVLVGYGWQAWQHRENVTLEFIKTTLWESFPLIWRGNLSHWLILALFALPWLIFSLHGFKLAWEERHWSWAKLLLVWGGLLFPISGFSGLTNFEEGLLLYPVLALAAGMALSQTREWSGDRPYPLSWSMGLFLAALLVFAGGIGVYFHLIPAFALGSVLAGKTRLLLMIGSFLMTLGVSGMLILRRNIRFMLILYWGMYVSLMLWFSSPHWNLMTLKY